MKTIEQKAKELAEAYPSYIRVLDLQASCAKDGLDPIEVFKEMVKQNCEV